MSLLFLQFVHNALDKAGLHGASVSESGEGQPLRFTVIPSGWTQEDIAIGESILDEADSLYEAEALRQQSIAAARKAVADAGITVLYEPTGEQLTLWARNESDYANYRNFSTQLKDAIEFGVPARSYRISTMQGGWDAAVLLGPGGDNRVELRRMIALYSDQAQQYYESII